MSCSTDEFECPSEPGLCVPADVICDGHGDCPDGNDELYCGKTGKKHLFVHQKQQGYKTARKI